MAESLGTAVLDLTTDNSGLDKGLSGAEKKTKSTFGRLAKVAGGLAIGAAVAGIAKSVIGDVLEGQKVAAQTEAVLKSTGGAANVTAQQVADLATALRNKSGVDDEAIATGANLLLTFTNIRNEAGAGNDVFNQTTAAALDMAVALGTDTKTAALQLGKALNDPAKGMTRLQRSGVTFTDAQKDLVKQLMASGDTLGAQKVILAEVNKEFGGSAEAAGKTLPGALAIMRGQFEDAAGGIVAKALPALQSFVQWCIDNWPKAQEIIERVVQAIRDAYPVYIEPFVDAAIAIFQTLVRTVRANWTEINNFIQARLKVLKGIIDVFAGILTGDWSRVWSGIKKIVTGTLESIESAIRLAISIIGAAARALGAAILNKIQEGIGNLIGWVRGKIDDIPGAITAALGAVGSAALSVGARVLNKIKEGIGDLAAAARNKVDDIPGGILSALSAVGSAASTLGGKILSGIASGIGDLGSWVLGKIRGAINAAIGGLEGRFNSALEMSFVVDTHIPGIGKQGISINPPDAHLPRLADGGIFNKATLGIFGEAGAEALIPLTNPKRANAIMKEAGLRGNGDGTTLVFNHTPANADPVAIGAVTSFALKRMRT